MRAAGRGCPWCWRRRRAALPTGAPPDCPGPRLPVCPSRHTRVTPGNGWHSTAASRTIPAASWPPPASQAWRLVSPAGMAPSVTPTRPATPRQPPNSPVLHGDAGPGVTCLPHRASRWTCSCWQCRTPLPQAAASKWNSPEDAESQTEARASVTARGRAGSSGGGYRMPVRAGTGSTRLIVLRGNPGSGKLRSQRRCVPGMAVASPWPDRTTCAEWPCVSATFRAGRSLSSSCVQLSGSSPHLRRSWGTSVQALALRTILVRR